jgi:hypothetical protein
MFILYDKNNEDLELFNFSWKATEEVSCVRLLIMFIVQEENLKSNLLLLVTWTT